MNLAGGAAHYRIKVLNVPSEHIKHMMSEKHELLTRTRKLLIKISKMVSPVMARFVSDEGADVSLLSRLMVDVQTIIVWTWYLVNSWCN
jgi:hypothetical protein